MPNDRSGQSPSRGVETAGSRAGRVPWVAVLLFGVAVGSVAIQANDHRRTPPADVLADAAEVIRREADDTTIVLTRPWWYNDGRIGLHGVTIHPGRPLDPLELHAWSHVVVATPPAWIRQVRRELEGWTGQPELLFDHRRYRVERRAVQLEQTVHWDALLSLGEAAIERRPADGGRSIPCTLRRGREWHCGRIDPWVHVADTWREVEDLQTQWCIALAVPHHQETMVLRWDDVPLGAHLRVRAGHDVHATRSHRGGPVDMRVFVDDALLWSRRFPPREQPWLLEDVALPPEQTTGQIRVELHTEDALDRFFCFRLLSFTR